MDELEEKTDLPSTWEEYVNYQQLIIELSLDTAELYSHLCKMADKYEVSRDHVLDMFFSMLNGIDYAIDAEDFDIEDRQHLS